MRTFNKIIRPIANPSKMIDEGSGTGAEEVSNIAPLFAVAIQFGALAVPSFRNPTIYAPKGMPPVIFSSGEMFGLDAPSSSTPPTGAMLSWYTKKPVAPGSEGSGINAPIGFAGEALIPKNASRSPLVQAVALNRVAVPEKVPVIVAGA